MNSQVACEDTLIPTKYISENVEKLSEMVEVEISKEINNSFSKSEIMDCAEMFISLNSCPSYLEKLYLKVFYESKTTGKIALFTSNIVKQSKSILKSKALKVFAKITPVLGFKHIWYKQEENQSFEENFKQMKNIVDIKGNKDKYFILSCLSKISSTFKTFGVLELPKHM